MDVGRSRVFILVSYTSNHTICSVIYSAIVTRGDVARVSTNLVLEIDLGRVLTKARVNINASFLIDFSIIFDSPPSTELRDPSPILVLSPPPVRSSGF